MNIFTKNVVIASAILIFAFGRAYSQPTNHWGDPVFGAKLSITLSNSVIMKDGKILLHCTIKNFFTNDVCFLKSDTREMYQVSLVAPSGKSFEINNPLDYNGSYNAGGKVSFEESREYDVPLELKKDLEPGSYKMIAKQRIYIFRKPNRQDVQQGELVSNLLEVQVK